MRSFAAKAAATLLTLIALNPSAEAKAKQAPAPVVGCINEGGKKPLCLDVDKTPGWKGWRSRGMRSNAPGAEHSNVYVLTFFRSDGSTALWNVQGPTEQVANLLSSAYGSTCYIACKEANGEGAQPGKLVGLVAVRGRYDRQKICQPSGWNTEGVVHDERLDKLCGEHFSHDSDAQDRFVGEGDSFYWLLNTHEVISIAD